MKIFSAAQIQQWDQFTIVNEPVTSINLMERAARACFDWLMSHGYRGRSYTIFAGKGNNGGDGLAIARMLSVTDHDVIVYILEFGYKGTEDFQYNLGKLHETRATIKFISTAENIHPVPAGNIVIDALFGSGLNRAPSGLNQQVIEHINASQEEVIAVDIPSGISADKTSQGHVYVIAKHTLSFQQPKLAFLMPENEVACGQVHILPIGLHPDFQADTDTKAEMLDAGAIRRLYKPRKDFGHKGIYGHALLISGSYGKMGAAVLAVTACLRSGAGLVTAHVPACGYNIMQISCPEAMTETDPLHNINSKLTYPTDKYNAVGIGPGLGQEPESASLLRHIIESHPGPIVFDADALNLIAANKDLLTRLPGGSVLTPHPKEFERLFGATANNFERMELASKMADLLNVVIVLKGHYTLVAGQGKVFFNSTGNSGMATGGTGDTLTGIITGLIAQQYNSFDAALLGVYLHGLAGDLAANETGKEALIASDLSMFLGKAFKSLLI
jgi:ADP-dependent NAD(P)H-hydrate dehydratase / NAD(P)H-hydrate epimerase